ncbi:MAG: hypothetical protein ACHQZR_05310 [Candidatus Limnocylindrales bacterium]
MAADDPFERRLAAGLHDLLDAETPPHPTWGDAPAAQRPTGRPVLVGGTRRGALWLLVAAILAAFIGTMLAVAGGRLPIGPATVLSPSPSGATASPTFATPSTTPTVASPSPTGVLPPPSPITSQTCATSFSDAGLTTDPSNPLHSVGVATYPGYDRVTFQAALPWSGIQVEPASPPFTDATGRPVSIEGSSYYRVVLEHSDAANLPPAQLDTLVSGAVVRQVTKVADYLGEPTWIVGLAGPACLDVAWVSSGSGEDFLIDFTIPLAFTPVSGGTCVSGAWSGPVGPAMPSIDHLQAVQDVHARDESVAFRIQALDGVTVRLEPAAPPFVRDPSGLPVTVTGSTFWRVILTGVEGSTLPPSELDQVRSGATIEAVQQIGDFEGVQSWIIGTHGPASSLCAMVSVAADEATVEVAITPLP